MAGARTIEPTTRQATIRVTTQSSSPTTKPIEEGHHGQPEQPVADLLAQIDPSGDLGPARQDRVAAGVGAGSSGHGVSLPPGPTGRTGPPVPCPGAGPPTTPTTTVTPWSPASGPAASPPRWCCPARDEEATVGRVLEAYLPLRDAGLLDEVLVVDSLSTDATAAVAGAAPRRAVGDVHPASRPSGARARPCGGGCWPAPATWSCSPTPTSSTPGRTTSSGCWARCWTTRPCSW